MQVLSDGQKKSAFGIHEMANLPNDGPKTVKQLETTKE